MANCSEIMSISLNMCGTEFSVPFFYVCQTWIPGSSPGMTIFSPRDDRGGGVRSFFARDDNSCVAIEKIKCTYLTKTDMSRIKILLCNGEENSLPPLAYCYLNFLCGYVLGGDIVM